MSQKETEKNHLNHQRNAVQPLVNSLKEALKEFELRESQGIREVLGLPFPHWPLLNETMSGLRPGTLTLLGGSRAQQRRAFLMEWCVALTRSSKLPALFVSFEMTVRDLVFARISRESALPFHTVASLKLLGDPLRKNKLQKGLKNLAPYQGLLHLSGGLEAPDYSSLDQEIKRIRSLGNQKSPVVFVDWLNVMSGDASESHEARVCSLARALKCLAVKHAVPVIAGLDFERSPQEVNADATEESVFFEQVAAAEQLRTIADHSFTVCLSHSDTREAVRLLENKALEKGAAPSSIPPVGVLKIGNGNSPGQSSESQGILFLFAQETGHCMELGLASDQEIVRFSRLEKQVNALDEQDVWNFRDAVTEKTDILYSTAGPTSPKEKIKVSVKLT